MKLRPRFARRRVFVAALGALVVLGGGATGFAASRARAPQLAWLRVQAGDVSAGGGGGGSTDSLRPAERTFIAKTLAVSRDQAEIAKLAVSQAASSSVRDFAQQLVGDYGQINNTLEVLARRKAVDVPLQPTSFSEPFRRLAEKTGRAFDREFVQMIASANDTTLRLCETAVSQAKDDDVRDAAGNFLPIVRDHLNKVTGLRKTLE